MRRRTPFSTDGAAVFSPCGAYRYTLRRRVMPAPGVCRQVNFIMLNPSKADGSTNDATIRRCLGFAESWGYHELVVTNLFAYRSTDPQRLYDFASPIGPDNDQHIEREALSSDLIVCAWGAHGGIGERGEAVLSGLFTRGLRPHALGFTESGHPRHPLRLSSKLKPEPIGG